MSNEIPLYYARRTKEGLVITGNMVARGTETRNHQTSKEPFSSLASRSLSEYAKAILRARNDDAEALEWLILKIANRIDVLAKSEGWKIKYDPAVIATIALSPYVTAPITKRAAAVMCNVDLKSFRLSWEPKLITVENWIKSYNAEINGKS